MRFSSITTFFSLTLQLVSWSAITVCFSVFLALSFEKPFYFLYCIVLLLLPSSQIFIKHQFVAGLSIILLLFSVLFFVSRFLYPSLSLALSAALKMLLCDTCLCCYCCCSRFLPIIRYCSQFYWQGMLTFYPPSLPHFFLITFLSLCNYSTRLA